MARMTYRDDRDTLLAKNEQLETELGAAREEIARLRGRGVRSNRWAGGPTRIELERELAGELPESVFEDLVVELRARFGDPGRVERLGHTVSWYTYTNPRGGGRRVAVHFTSRGGKTRVRIEESMGQLAGGLFGGIVGGAGGAGAVNLVVWGIILGNVLLILGAVAWLALVFGIVRTAYGAVARKRVRELETFASELEERLHGASAKSEGKKLRVSAESEDAENEERDEEETHELETRDARREEH